MSKLPYPVQRSARGHVARRVAEAAYRDYERRYGKQQSIDRMAERGGLSWSELVYHLYSELTHTDDHPLDLIEEDGS